MSEEINQQEVEEITREGDGTNPEGSANGAGAESNATEAESLNLTPEQIQELIEYRKKYQSLEPEFTRKSQELSAERQRRQEYEQAILSLQGKRQEQENPEMKAEAELAEAMQSFDPQRIATAIIARDRVREQRILNQATAQALNAFQIRRAIDEAQQEFGYTEAQLQETLQGIQRNPKQLAVLRAYNEGKLEDHLKARQRADKEREARDAEDHSSQASGRNRGPLRKGPLKDPHPHPATFAAWTDSKRKRHIKEHGLPPYVTEVSDD